MPDMQFPAEAVYKLLEYDEDVVAGIYPKKIVNWKALEAASNAGVKDLKSFAGTT